MLVRDAGDDWLLITQRDHARLAADLAAAVAEPPTLPGDIVWDDVIDAILHHDDGWFERDARPIWDPDRKRVRNFDEYTLPEATAIWRDSVRRVHALATQPAEWFDRRIDRRLYEWVWCALSTAVEPLRWDELLSKYVAQVGPPLPESALREVVAAMRKAGSVLDDGSRIALDPWHRPRASLKTLWVSSHFDALAELAEARHAEDFAQVAAAKVFRADHRRWHESAESACAGLVSADEFAALAETGFRAVQFFDRLSLALCLQPLPFRQRISAKGWPQVDWSADAAGKIVTRPELFGANSTVFEVTAQRVPLAAGSSAETWETACRAIAPTPLRWQCLPG